MSSVPHGTRVEIQNSTSQKFQPTTHRIHMPSFIDLGPAVSWSLRVLIMLTFYDHVTNVVKSCNYHTRAIRHIRHLLTQSAAQTLACSLVNSRLDYCNSLLLGTRRCHSTGCREPRILQLVWLWMHTAVLTPNHYSGNYTLVTSTPDNFVQNGCPDP